MVERKWSLEDVVRMAEEFLKQKEEAAFAEAFDGEFADNWIAPQDRRKTPTPQKPKTPWYHDPESGGPNPPEHLRKEGIAYEQGELFEKP